MKNVKKPTKLVKPKKSAKLKKSSVKSIDPETVAVGAGIGAALLGLAYIGVISPILKKKRIDVEEARENSAVNETARNKLAEKAESVKERTLKLVADIKTVVESYSQKTFTTSTSTNSRRATYKDDSNSVPYQPRRFSFPGLPLFPVWSSQKTSPNKSIPDPTTIASKTSKGPSKTPRILDYKSPSPIFPVFNPKQQADNEEVLEKQKADMKRLRMFAFKSKSSADTSKGLFTKNQKRQIVEFLQKRQDPANYISSIIGHTYLPYSSIKLSALNPIEEHLYVIQSEALGVQDYRIMEGLEKLRKKLRGIPVNMLQMESSSSKNIDGIQAVKTIGFDYSPENSGFEKIYKKSTLQNKLDTLDILEKMEAHNLRLSEKK